MSEADRRRDRVRLVIAVPAILLILLGAAMVVMGVGILAKNVWVGLLLILVGIGGPGFRGAIHLRRSRS